MPTPHKSAIDEYAQPESVPTEVDMVAISRILLRVLAHLKEREYTDSCNERQADVVVHDDPPDPASDEVTARG